MFMGEYNHTIDAKGRLIVPSKFREVLGDEFVVTKGMDGCLFVFDEPEWKNFEEKLRGLPMIDKEARQFTRFFLAGAASVEVDKQGRILAGRASGFCRNYKGRRIGRRGKPGGDLEQRQMGRYRHLSGYGGNFQTYDRAGNWDIIGAI